MSYNKLQANAGISMCPITSSQPSVTAKRDGMGTPEYWLSMSDDGRPIIDKASQLSCPPPPPPARKGGTDLSSKLTLQHKSGSLPPAKLGRTPIRTSAIAFNLMAGQVSTPGYPCRLSRWLHHDLIRHFTPPSPPPPGHSHACPLSGEKKARMPQSMFLGSDGVAGKLPNHLAVLKEVLANLFCICLLFYIILNH